MKGFTLVETLVAITIVLLAVMGPFQLVKDSLTASYVARDQLVATALAEEGLEYVRSVRDGNYLYSLEHSGAGRSWLHGLSACIDDDGCIVDPVAGTVAGCSASCLPLRTNAAGLYTQQLGAGTTATRFTRKVTLEEIGTDREVRVTVEVSFSTRHTPFTVTVTDNLYNWL